MSDIRPELEIDSDRDPRQSTTEITDQSFILSRLVRRFLIGTFTLFSIVLVSFSIVKIVERTNDHKNYLRNLEGIDRLKVAFKSPVSLGKSEENPSRIIEHWGLLGSEGSLVFQTVEVARLVHEKKTSSRRGMAETDEELDYRTKIIDRLLGGENLFDKSRPHLFELQSLLHSAELNEKVIEKALLAADSLIHAAIEKNWLRLFWELLFRILPFIVCSVACFLAFGKMARNYSEFAENLRKRENLLLRKDQSKGLILDSLSEGILEYELESKTWITISKRFMGLLEESEDGALTHRFIRNGMNAWYNCVHPRDRTTISVAMERLLREGKRFKKTVRFITEQGNIRTFEINAVARITKGTDSTRGVLAISHRDVSAQIAAEAHKNLLVSMIGRSPDLFLIYNQQGVPLFASPAGKAIGLDKVSERFSKIFRPLDPTLKSEDIFERVKRQSIWRGEVRLVESGSSEKKLFFQTVFPVQGDQEGSTHFAVVAQDVSEKVRQSEALEMVRERMNLALDSGKMGVWDWNLETSTLDWDGHVRKIFDLPEGDLPSFEFFKKRIHPEDLPKIELEIEKSIRTNSVFSTRFRIIIRNGEVRTIRATGEVKYDECGRPLRMVGLNWDAAKEVDDENALISARHSQLNNARLASIGEMAGGIAHEINNPLGVITAKAYLMRSALRKILETNEFEKFDKDLSLIESNGFRISKIVKGLRNLSREDPAGLVFYPTDAKDLLEDGLAFCRERFRGNGVDLRADCDGISNLTVDCNSTQISQIILNLLNNAHDAAQEKPDPWVSIRSWKDDVFLHIVVSDSGPGVSEAIEAKIMEPFFTTKPTGKGTGLGLSISHSIATLHGGRLFLDRSIGPSAFHIELPIRQKPARKSA